MPIQRDLFGKQKIPDVATASGIRDNHSRGIVGDFLKGNINDGTRLSVMSAFFTIYAYDALKERLDRIGEISRSAWRIPATGDKDVISGLRTRKIGSDIFDFHDIVRQWLWLCT